MEKKKKKKSHVNIFVNPAHRKNSKRKKLKVQDEDDLVDVVDDDAGYNLYEKYLDKSADSSSVLSGGPTDGETGNNTNDRNRDSLGIKSASSSQVDAEHECMLVIRMDITDGTMT